VQLLDVWPDVLAHVADATLVIAGDGPDMRTVRARVAERDLAGRVFVLGHRSDSDRLIAASDVLVLPSRSEGMSNVALQALALGKPVVGFAIPGVDELVGDGRVAPAGDFAAFATHLGAVLSSAALRDDLGSTGRELVRTRYSIDEVAGQYGQLYDELAA
jgi:glycosyltransferase involved in cell wall biosynthesis